MISSAEEFVRLRDSEDPAESTRAAIEAATSEVWMAVIRRHPAHRRWVAYNKTVPGEILQILAGDIDPAVRWMVAMRHGTPPAILQDLAGDPDETVRARVAHNPRTAPSVLLQLTADESVTVRDAARARVTPGI